MKHSCCGRPVSVGLVLEYARAFFQLALSNCNLRVVSRDTAASGPQKVNGKRDQKASWLARTLAEAARNRIGRPPRASSPSLDPSREISLPQNPRAPMANYLLSKLRDETLGKIQGENHIREH